MSLTLSQSLLQIELFDDNVDIEIVETIESTAATLTRFKAMNQGNLHNLIYKEFRPNWVGGGSAELTWYYKYAASVTLSICPNFYGGQLNRDQRRCFLFLEDISNSHFKVPEYWPCTSVQKELLEAVVDFMLPLHIRWYVEKYQESESSNECLCRLGMHGVNHVELNLSKRHNNAAGRPQNWCLFARLAQGSEGFTYLLSERGFIPS